MNKVIHFSLLVDIRRHLKNSNRPAAMKLLRKKKLLEREHEKKEGTIEQLNTVLTQIEQTDYSSMVNQLSLKQHHLFSACHSDCQCLFIRCSSSQRNATQKWSHPRCRRRYDR